VREQGLRGYILLARALGLDFFSIYATANTQQADNGRTKQNCVYVVVLILSACFSTSVEYMNIVIVIVIGVLGGLKSMGLANHENV
jgi:hypothetical protein